MIALVRVIASDEDVLATAAKNPGWKVERTSNGQLVMTPPAGGRSSRRSSRLTGLIDEWARHSQYVAFDSSGGFLLADSSIVAPDAALVEASPWNALSEDQQEGIVPLVPAVAIELVSRTDDPTQIRAKLERLLAMGTGYVVLIDPYRKVIWREGTPPAGFDLNFDELLA